MQTLNKYYIELNKIINIADIYVRSYVETCSDGIQELALVYRKSDDKHIGTYNKTKKEGTIFNDIINKVVDEDLNINEFHNNKPVYFYSLTNYEYQYDIEPEKAQQFFDNEIAKGNKLDNHYKNGRGQFVVCFK